MQTQSETTARSNGSRERRAATSTGHIIERGIPIPERIPFGGKHGQGRPAALDLSALSVGDSVFLKGATKPALSRARANALNASKRAGITTTARSVAGGLRVWRTA